MTALRENSTPAAGSVRQATVDDLPTLEQFWSNLFTETNDPVPDSDLPNRLCEYTWVAEVDGNVVGYVNGEVKNTHAMVEDVGRDAFPNEDLFLEIDDMYVMPDYRHRGIGEQLMHAALGTAESRGVKRSMVYSDCPNYVQTARFYEKCGYKMWYIFMTR